MASIIPGYEYDIFISYRQKDNKVDGWVTEFVDILKRELESMFKEEVSVYFDINPHDGLLETHDVDESLKEKLRCLIFIPIISRTYCDPKSFAWEHEFKVFVEQAPKDHFGLKVKLPNGNVANRVLPVRIHDLDIADIKLFESVIGGVLRSIDFVYKEIGVNRQLRSKDDDVIKNPNQILYRDQINKVAHAIKDIIESMKILHANTQIHDTGIQVKEETVKNDLLIVEPVGKGRIRSKQKLQTDKIELGEGKKVPFLRKSWILVPCVIIIVAILLISILSLYHRSKVRWAEEVAIPEIQRYVDEENFVPAFNLLQKAEKYISEEPKFKELVQTVTFKLTILTDPPGADVYAREYSKVDGEWKKLGITPISKADMPYFSFYLIKIEKPGYENVLAVAPTELVDTIYRKLFKSETIPPGMVYVEGYWDFERNFLIKDCGFFMDRYEVTNRQFKEFVDNGGYRNKQYWKNDFIKDGKVLIWEEARAEFTDKTGRTGPANWEAGDYPEGQDDNPVSGVSWYEAAAYAEYSGKNLPTSDDWANGAGFYIVPFYIHFNSKIFLLSNFYGKGPEPGGKNQGVNCFGAFDMAGNVREWCWNETQNGRAVRGGGWDDKVYMYNAPSQLPPFDRSPKNGFRCVQYTDKGKIPVSAFRKLEISKRRDYSEAEPVHENIFRIYKEQFLYDSTALDAIVEKRDESPRDWSVEKIAFNAAYENERMIAYLYLPKNASPPFQTIIYFPGGNALSEKDLVNNRITNGDIDFILKNGRALMYPVYKGTFERNDGTFAKVTTPLSHQYTEWVIKWVKDFSRSIDYLETRKDIDKNKLGFYGSSWGGNMGGIIPAVEDRLKVSILVTAGISTGYPEISQINYLPRIRIPVLMLNGKYDFSIPFETNVKVFFDHLGTPEHDKRLCAYETDHYVPKGELIKESLNWLDRYLGPVK